MSTSEWCTVESDPGVFSELIANFGVPGVAVEEIYSLDESRKEKSYGLIFLFKWQQNLPPDDREALDPSFIPELFFAKQVVTNACATQAILSVLLNADGIELGETLGELKAFSSSMDSETKGIVIGNSEPIRQAHNSFARAEPFFHEKVAKRLPTSDDDVYHFIAYLPFLGGVYELDGLKPGPILLGGYDGDDWWSVAKPAIEARMSQYAATENHFALMSIGEKKSTLLEAEINSLVDRLNVVDIAAAAQPNEELERERATSLGVLESLRAELASEREKEANQAQENIRRRHNYVPLIIELLKGLSKKGALDPLITAAQSKRVARVSSNHK